MAPRRSRTHVDTSLLSQEERDAIGKRATAAAAKELKQRQEDEFYKASLQAAREANDPDEALESFTLDLAGHSDRITLDGTVYFHGRTYEVSMRLKQTLKDIVARTWEHEDEVGGVNRDQHRPVRSVALSPRAPNGITTSRLGGGLM